MNIKCVHHLSKGCYNAIFNFISEVLPNNNKFIDSFYKTKKKKCVYGLGLTIEHDLLGRR